MSRVEIRLGPTAEPLGVTLRQHGFVHLASFRPNPADPTRYAGEQLWSRPVAPLR